MSQRASLLSSQASCLIAPRVSALARHYLWYRVREIRAPVPLLVTTVILYGEPIPPLWILMRPFHSTLHLMGTNSLFSLYSDVIFTMGNGLSLSDSTRLCLSRSRSHSPSLYELISPAASLCLPVALTFDIGITEICRKTVKELLIKPNRTQVLHLNTQNIALLHCFASTQKHYANLRK